MELSEMDKSDIETGKIPINAMDANGNHQTKIFFNEVDFNNVVGLNFNSTMV